MEGERGGWIVEKPLLLLLLVFLEVDCLLVVVASLALAFDDGFDLAGMISVALALALLRLLLDRARLRLLFLEAVVADDDVANAVVGCAFFTSSVSAPTSNADVCVCVVGTATSEDPSTPSVCTFFFESFFFFLFDFFFCLVALLSTAFAAVASGLVSAAAIMVQE